MNKIPRLSTKAKADLLRAFEGLCRAMGVTSCGFNRYAISAFKQYALSYQPRAGWMIVSGLGGCGAPLSRWNGYIKTTRDMMLAMEMAAWAINRKEEE